MILAQVPLEHVDDDVQVRFDVTDMCRQARVGFPELLVGALLRRRKLTDDRSHSDQAVSDAGDSCLVCGLRFRHLGNICSELRLLVEQKLHRALHLLGRHRLKIHDKT